jgi:hypothetical protein
LSKRANGVAREWCRGLYVFQKVFDLPEKPRLKPVTLTDLHDPVEKALQNMNFAYDEDGIVEDGGFSFALDYYVSFHGVSTYYLGGANPHPSIQNLWDALIMVHDNIVNAYDWRTRRMIRQYERPKR